MTTDPIEPLQTRDLVALRTLLDQALRAARSPGDLQRLTALVLLDAANERVLHLVAVSRGLAGAQTRFEDLASKVKQDLGDAWRPSSLATVRRLHRARNAAQHEGIGADRSDVASFMAATSDFVASLASAAFAIDLERVSLSAAVTTSEVRDALEKAEAALADDDAAGAVRAAAKAFEVAQARWASQHQQAGRRRMRPFRDEIWGSRAFEYLEGLASEAREAALLYPFAADPGDVGWFAELSAASETATPEEAERAVSFVFWWVVNWEAATPFGRGDRRLSYLRSRRRVRRARTAARVSGVAVGESNWRDSPVLEIELADVPDEPHFDSWSRAVTELLAARVPSVAGSVRMGVDATLHIALTETVVAPDVVEATYEVLREAEQLLTRKAAAAADEEAAWSKLKGDWRRDLSGEPLPAWVSSVALEQRHGETFVAIELTPDRPALDVASELREHTAVDQCWWTGSRSQLAVTPVLPSPEMANVLREVDARIAPTLRSEAEKALQHQAWITDLHAEVVGLDAAVKRRDGDSA